MVKVYIPAQECYTNSVCFPDNYYRLYNSCKISFFDSQYHYISHWGTIKRCISNNCLDYALLSMWQISLPPVSHFSLFYLFQSCILQNIASAHELLLNSNVYAVFQNSKIKVQYGLILRLQNVVHIRKYFKILFL